MGVLRAKPSKISATYSKRSAQHARRTFRPAFTEKGELTYYE